MNFKRNYCLKLRKIINFNKIILNNTIMMNGMKNIQKLKFYSNNNSFISNKKNIQLKILIYIIKNKLMI